MAHKMTENAPRKKPNKLRAHFAEKPIETRSSRRESLGTLWSPAQLVAFETVHRQQKQVDIMQMTSVFRHFSRNTQTLSAFLQSIYASTKTNSTLHRTNWRRLIPFRHNRKTTTFTSLVSRNIFRNYLLLFMFFKVITTYIMINYASGCFHNSLFSVEKFLTATSQSFWIKN